MRPTSVKLGPFAAASATRFHSASSITAGAVTLATTTVDTNGTARRILFTFASDETGLTLTVVGPDWNGQTQTETIAGTTPGTVGTVFDYKTLTSITASQNSAGNVSIGTSGVASTRPVFLDPYASAQIMIQVACTGSTQNYTVEFCATDPNKLSQGFPSTDPGYVAWGSLTWIANQSALSNKTAGAAALQDGVFLMARMSTSNAGSSTTDSAIATFTQAQNAPF